MLEDRASSSALRSELQLARETPEESGVTEPQIREARRLFNRLSAVLLLPAVRLLGDWLDLFESREAPVTRIELFPLTPAATELQRRATEIASRLDPELPRKPDGLAKAQALLKRFYTLDFEVSARELMAQVQYWDTLSPAPTEEELAPVRNATRNLEAKLEQVLFRLQFMLNERVAL